MNLILVNVILLSVMSIPVWSQPDHISGPDDAHVFAGEDATLRCRVTNLTPSYAVGWQYFDGYGNGFLLGICYKCSSSSSQIDCTTRWEKDSITMTTSKILEDTFELRIHGVDVPNRVQFGYYQCGYVIVNGCESGKPPSTDIFVPLQSAIVYVYSRPRCIVALASSMDPDVTTQELTCIWEPRFYDVRDTAVQTQLLIDNAVLQPNLSLPNGIVQRSTMKSPLAELRRANVTCMLTLPSGESNTTSCKFPGTGEVSLSIEPLVTSVHVGETQVVNCSDTEDGSDEYHWVFFRYGEEEVVTSSMSKLVGHMQFLSDSKGSFQVTPHSNASRGQVFVECRVDTPGVRNASAFGSIKILEARVVDISTSGPVAFTSQIKSTHTPSTTSPISSLSTISRIASIEPFSESHLSSNISLVDPSSLKPTGSFPSSKPTGFLPSSPLHPTQSPDDNGRSTSKSSDSFPSSKPTASFPLSLTTQSPNDNGSSTPKTVVEDMDKEGGSNIVPFVIAPIVIIAVFVGLAITYFKRKQSRSFKQVTNSLSENITKSVGNRETMITEVNVHIDKNTTKRARDEVTMVTEVGVHNDDNITKSEGDEVNMGTEVGVHNNENITESLADGLTEVNMRIDEDANQENHELTHL